MSSKRMSGLVSVGVVVGALLSIAPAAAAQASIYTWKYYATYATSTECEGNGKALVQGGEADAYRCTGAAATVLDLGYIW